MNYEMLIFGYPLLALVIGFISIFMVIWLVSFTSMLKELRETGWRWKRENQRLPNNRHALEAFVLYYKTGLGRTHVYLLMAICVWLTLAAVAKMVMIFIEVNG